MTGGLVTRPTPLYRAGRALSGLALQIGCLTRVEGRERVPAQGPALLVSNHQSYLDIPLIAWALRRRHVCFVARESLSRSRFLALVMRESGVVLIRPGEADRQALRGILEHLQAGDLVAIFPEGTRTPDGRVGPFRGGALVAARRSGAPVVPVGIRGAFAAWPRTRAWPRPSRVSVAFGEPLDAAAPDALERARDAVVALVGDGRFRPRRSAAPLPPPARTEHPPRTPRGGEPDESLL